MSEKHDLRVTRTEQSIRRALYGMILEREYHEITVKELAQRAMINRNTFYLHYPSVEALMETLQNEVVKHLLSMYISFDNLEDVKETIRRYFEYVTARSPLMERLFFCDSYRFVAQNISQQLAAHRKKMRHGVFSVSEPAEDLVLAYCGSAMTALYRQWIADGKQLTVEELITLATNLICNGLKNMIKP